MKKNRTIFATFITDKTDQFCTRLLIDSLRAFGGTSSQSRFMVFCTDHKLDAKIISRENVDFFTLKGKNQGAQYFFADKVRTWAQAESYAKEHFDTLVWIDPTCLVVNPPTLFTLDNETLAAFRPVHIRNIGDTLHALKGDALRTGFKFGQKKFKRSWMNGKNTLISSTIAHLKSSSHSHIITWMTQGFLFFTHALTPVCPNSSMTRPGSIAREEV